MQQPSRLPDWPARLAALVVARLAVPFAWGANDCAAWVADAVRAQRGADVLAELRCPRSTWRQAQRQIKRLGGLPAVLQRAGLQPVPPALAQRGDVLLLRPGASANGQPGAPVLAICNGAQALAPGPEGLAQCPMGEVECAWRV